MNRQTRANRLLAQRARTKEDRVPMIFVPPVMGTKLVDSDGGRIWGSAIDVFRGVPRCDSPDAKPEGLLEDFSIVPGLLSYDVFGGLLTFLQRVGGYTLGEDLFVLDYDGRKGVVSGAQALNALVSRIQGVSSQEVDIVAVSSGGLVARYYLGYGGEDVLSGRRPSRGNPVRRVVYLGVPQRGFMESVIELEFGLKMARGSRTISSKQMTKMQLPFDMLPHPEDEIFLDPEGNPLSIDIFTGESWRSMGFHCAAMPGFDQRLQAALELRAALDAISPHPSCFAICARHKATSAKAIVQEDGSITWPCCLSTKDPQYSLLNRPGDGTVVEASLSAVPGLEAEKIWWVEPRKHRLIASDSRVHALVLEALLSTERTIKSELYSIRVSSVS